MADAAALHEEYLETVNQRDFTHMRDMFHADYTYTGSDGETAAGPDAGVAVAQTYVNAFPDLVLTVDRHYAVSGDISIIEFTASGTQTGDLPGIPATGRSARVKVCDIIEVKDGKICCEREYYDSLSLMQQLGVIPTES